MEEGEQPKVRYPQSVAFMTTFSLVNEPILRRIKGCLILLVGGELEGCRMTYGRKSVEDAVRVLNTPMPEGGSTWQASSEALKNS